MEVSDEQPTPVYRVTRQSVVGDRERVWDEMIRGGYLRFKGGTLGFVDDQGEPVHAIAPGCWVQVQRLPDGTDDDPPPLAEQLNNQLHTPLSPQFTDGLRYVAGDCLELIRRDGEWWWHWTDAEMQDHPGPPDSTVVEWLNTNQLHAPPSSPQFEDELRQVTLGGETWTRRLDGIWTGPFRSYSTDKQIEQAIERAHQEAMRSESLRDNVQADLPASDTDTWWSVTVRDDRVLLHLGDYQFVVEPSHLDPRSQNALAALLNQKMLDVTRTAKPEDRR